MNIKEIAPKLTQKLSIAINDDEAVEFAEALISAYKTDLLKEVGEPVLYAEFAEDGGWLGYASEYADHLEEPHALFTSDQVTAAITKATKPLDEEIERLNRQVDNFNELDRKLEDKASMDLTSMPDAICELRQQLEAAQEELSQADCLNGKIIAENGTLKEQLATAEQRVAEACTLLCMDAVTKSKSSLFRSGAIIVAGDIRDGEWRKFVKEV